MCETQDSRVRYRTVGCHVRQPGGLLRAKIVEGEISDKI